MLSSKLLTHSELSLLYVSAVLFTFYQRTIRLRTIYTGTSLRNPLQIQVSIESLPQEFS